MDQGNEGYQGPERRGRDELLIRIDERVLSIKDDVEELKQGVAAIREVQVRYDPAQYVPRFSKTTREWEEYKTTRKAERRIYATIAAVVATLLTLILSPIAQAIIRNVTSR